MRIKFFVLCALLSVLALSGAAQTVLPTRTNPAALNILIGSQEIKFQPQQAQMQLRLQVHNHLGELLYDSGVSASTGELNWNLKDHNGATLTGGLYRYALTMRDAAEKELTQSGTLIIEQDQQHLWITTKNDVTLGANAQAGELTVTHGGDRSVAGLLTAEGKSVKRDVSEREIIDERSDEKSHKLPDAIKAAKQEKAALLGTASQMAKFNSTGTILIDSLVTETGGNVGIGTTTPLAVLDMVKPGATDVVFRMQNGTRAWCVGVSGTGDFWRIRDNTAGVARLVISNTGRVGIGTASPVAMLHATGSALYGVYGVSSAFNGTGVQGIASNGESANGVYGYSTSARLCTILKPCNVNKDFTLPFQELNF